MAKELRKVLFVDDDEDIHMILKMCLKEIPQLEVRSAFSGSEALELAQASPPDLIILDVMMPKMDGPETLQALKKLPSLQAIPVVFLTAKAEKSELEGLLKCGAKEVLTKPFDIKTFPKQILDIWNRS